MVSSQTNVASKCRLHGRIEDLGQKFVDAGYPYGQIPDFYGWIDSAVFSGHVIGTVGIRDELGGFVALASERDAPYSGQQKRNFLRDGDVFAKCSYPVDGMPIIAKPELEEISWQIFRAKPRRNRKK